MKKKVFSKEKFIEAERSNVENKLKIHLNSWVPKVDGLTADEIKKMGYAVNEKWFIEVDAEDVDTKDNELIDMANKIKKYCESRGCLNCVFMGHHMGDYSCVLINSMPSRWKLSD